LVVTDVSEEPTGPIFEGQAVQEKCTKKELGGSWVGSGVGGDWFSGIKQASWINEVWRVRSEARVTQETEKN